MSSRPLILASLLGASIGVPYVVTHTSSDASHAATPTVPPPHAAPVQPGGPQAFSPGPGSLVYQSPAPLEGATMHSLSDVLRFDVTREWVYRNWARKSTGLADPELFGVRVPLVTGIGMADVAGSLTYYFNDQGQVQHIKLVGRTADTTGLVRFLVDTYGFQRAPAPVGEQLYQVMYSGLVQSRLVTRPEPVLWATSPHASFSVELELERPGSNRYLPPSEPQLQIPATADAAAPPPAKEASKAAGAGAEDGGPESSLIGSIRPATREEEAPMRALRWPH